MCKRLLVGAPKRQGKCIMEEYWEQVEKDIREFRQRIADYDTFVWYCTEFKGLDLETANYCWKHRDE